MSENIRKYKQLTVISDTGLITKGDKRFGFGPVVRELEYISPMFEKIVWIGFERNDNFGNQIYEQIQAKNIETILLNRCGGDYILDKIEVLLNFPKMLFIIVKNIKKAEVIHTRAPSSPAFIAVLLSYLYRGKIWWNKYAGNWAQKNPPFFYGIQRRLLSNAKHTNVTINGFWLVQPKHCLSFENPCLTKQQIASGKKIQSKKIFKSPFRLIFVGNLTNQKGVHKIIEALRNIDTNLIERIDFIGDGPNKKNYRAQALFLGEKVFFHGSLDNVSVHHLLSDAHFLLLPSTTEGFPKVIAEAACYGCIPIVSDISCIGQYVRNDTCGFLWKINGSNDFSNILEKALTATQNELKMKSKNILKVAEKFTYDNYGDKLRVNILKM